MPKCRPDRHPRFFACGGAFPCFAGATDSACLSPPVWVCGRASFRGPWHVSRCAVPASGRVVTVTGGSEFPTPSTRTDSAIDDEPGMPARRGGSSGRGARRPVGTGPDVVSRAVIDLPPLMDRHPRRPLASGTSGGRSVGFCRRAERVRHPLVVLRRPVLTPGTRSSDAFDGWSMWVCL